MFDLVPPRPSLRTQSIRRTLRILACALVIGIGMMGIGELDPSAPRCSASALRAAEFEPRAFAITKAKLVVAPGQTVNVGTLVVRDGLIVAVGPDVAIPPDAETIDASGLTVYPGFIDAATSALLDPAKPAVPAAGRPFDFSRFVLAEMSSDNRKSLTPEFSADEHLKLEAADLEARRKLGFTSIHVVPNGRIAAGSGVLVTTGGGPLREAILERTTVSTFQLSAAVVSGPQGGGPPTYPSTLMGGTAHLRQAFLDAKQHARHWELAQAHAPGVPRPFNDETLQSLNRVSNKQQTAMFFANSRDEIHRTLDFAQEHGLSLLLWGGKDAFRCVDRLKEQNTGLVLQLDYGDEPKLEPRSTDGKLSATEPDPTRVQEDRRELWKQRLAGPAALNAQNVRFAFGTQGLKSPADLFKALRQVIQAGLPRDAALAALTTHPAQFLGREASLGTLAPGKLAHLVVLTGAFDQEQSQVRYLFLDGKKYEYNPSAKPLPEGTDATSAPGLEGTWQLEIDSSDGKVAATLALSIDGKNLKGSLQTPQGNGKVVSGSSTAEGFEFVVAIGAGDRSIELKFAGKPAEGNRDKISGTLKSAFGAAANWSAERKAAEKTASANPVQLKFDDQSGAAQAPSSGANASLATPSKPTELPSELEADRLRHTLRTGGNVFIKQATVLTGRGETLPDTSVLIKGGKIAAIGRELRPDPEMVVIDATGKYLMPGIIDTHSHIMITEGINEFSQSIVPEVRVKDVIWTDDVSEYRALAGGVTTARLLHGSANVIGGQDAVVKLKYGATAREQIQEWAPQGVKFALGENVKFRSNRFPATRMGVEATLNRAFLEALDYRRQWMEYDKAIKDAPEKASQLLPPRRDLRLEALMDIVEQKKFIHSHCYRADEILMLLRIASGLGVRVWSLQHVLEGYKVAPEIAAHGASCSTFSDWWAFKIEAYDATPYNVALLRQAGANVALKSDDWELIRHLNLEAAKITRYGGLSPDQALQTITFNSARELGLQERIGSIEVGKDADLALFNGHPLNSFSRCEQTLIEGEIRFTRDQQPSAMSSAGANRLATDRTLALPASEQRERRLDLTPAQNGQYALVGAHLHPVDAPDIAGGTLLVSGNKIVGLGKDLPIPTDAQRIDVSGLHIYPGLIDAGSTLGLIEIGKVVETHDSKEGGQFQPDLRAGVAVNPDSELIPVARAGGITTLLTHPNGGIVSGQCSIIKLDGWTTADMVLDYEAALQIFWPSQENTAKEQLESLKEFFKQGRLYLKLRDDAAAQNQPGPIADPRLDALRPYISGKKPVMIEANSRKEIAEALIFAEEEKIQPIITGGLDAWKVADELKKRNVPVVVGPVMQKPSTNHDPSDAPYANAGRLWEAGVTFCIRSSNASNSRNAPFEAAMAVAFGLPEEEGLKAVTLSAAKVLGLDRQIGSLTPDKSANLIVTDGSPLQPSTLIKAIFVNGKPYAPESRHTRLYDKYRARLQK